MVRKNRERRAYLRKWRRELLKPGDRVDVQGRKGEYYVVSISSPRDDHSEVCIRCEHGAGFSYKIGYFKTSLFHVFPVGF